MGRGGIAYQLFNKRIWDSLIKWQFSKRVFERCTVWSLHIFYLPKHPFALIQHPYLQLRVHEGCPHQASHLKSSLPFLPPSKQLQILKSPQYFLVWVKAWVHSYQANNLFKLISYVSIFMCKMEVITAILMKWQHGQE